MLQDPYVARKIFETNPIKHIDVGSRVDGFLLQLSIFRKIEVFDIRGFPVDLNNITYTIIDFTKLNQEYYNYTTQFLLYMHLNILIRQIWRRIRSGRPYKRH